MRIQITAAVVQGQTRPDIGGEAQTDTVLVGLVALGHDLDRHPVVGVDLVLQRHDLDIAVILAAEQTPLESEQDVGVVDIAGLEADIALEQILVEQILLEAHRAETVLRAGLQMEENVRLIGQRVDEHLMAIEPIVQIAGRSRRITEVGLGLFVGSVQEHIAGLHGEGLGKDRIDRARPRDLIIDPGDPHRLARLDAILGTPGALAIGRAFEPILDLDTVEPKGGERLADLIRGAQMQGLDARGGQVGLGAFVVDAQERQDIGLVLALESLDPDLEFECPGRCDAEQPERQREHDPRLSMPRDTNHCKAMKRAAPSSGVLGCRMTRTGMRRISEPMRPLSKNPSRKPPRRRHSRFFKAIPPPR